MENTEENKNETAKSGEHLPAIKEVQPFSEIEKALAKFKAEQASLVFDISTPDGEKACRSHVHTIRRVKGKLDAVKKDAKADILELGRLIDKDYNRIKDELDGVIDDYMKPILEREEKEQKRIAAHQENLEALRKLVEWPATMASMEPSSEQVQEQLAALEALVVDESWEEFMAEGVQLKKVGQIGLEEFLAKRQKAEKEAAELEELRQKQAQQEQEERERKIREEAAREAQEKADKAEHDRRNAIQVQIAALGNIAEQLQNENAFQEVEAVELALRDLKLHVVPVPEWGEALYKEQLPIWEKAIKDLEALKVTLEEEAEAARQRQKEQARIDTIIAEVVGMAANITAVRVEAVTVAQCDEYLDKLLAMDADDLGPRQEEYDAAHDHAFNAVKSKKQARIDWEKAEDERKEKERQEAQKAEERKRQEDATHKLMIEREAIKAIDAIIAEDGTGGLIVEAIAEGKIPHVKIEY